MTKNVKQHTEETNNLPVEKPTLTEHQTRKRIEAILEKRKFDDLFDL